MDNELIVEIDELEDGFIWEEPETPVDDMEVDWDDKPSRQIPIY